MGHKNVATTMIYTHVLKKPASASKVLSIGFSLPAVVKPVRSGTTTRMNNTKPRRSPTTLKSLRDPSGDLAIPHSAALANARPSLHQIGRNT